MLFTLNYVSRSLIDATGPEMDAIKAVALSRNAASHVTGALYLDGSLFFQVLEGREADVRAIYDAIKADPRHRDVRLIASGPLRSRRFAGWSMKFVDRSALPEGAPRPRLGSFRAPEARTLSEIMEKIR